MRSLALLLGAVLCAPAQANDQHPLLPEGTSLYKQFCSHCHGINMVNPGTSSYDLRRFPQDDKTRFVSAVTKGKGDMPAWGDILLTDEVDAIWVYVATRAGKEPYPEGAASDATEPGGGQQDTADFQMDAPLTACLARNGGAMSGWRHSGGTGFDYAILKTVAEKLGTSLDVTWFDSSQDEFADPIPEAYGMLSYGLCDVVAAHPVIPGAVGPPPAKTAALPRWTDMPPSWDTIRQIELQALAASRPYRRVELGIVVTGAALDRQISDLQDLSGTNVGVQQGTMSEAILRRQGPPEAMRTAVTVSPGPKFLWEMESGRFETTLIEIGAYDFHRRQNHITALELSDYRHPLGLDISLAVLAARADLLDALDAALAELETQGAFSEIAGSEGVTYIAPVGGPATDFGAALR